MASRGDEKPISFPQRHDCSYREIEIRRRKICKQISPDHESTKTVANLSDTILSGFEVLWRQNLMCDVFIQSEEKTFSAHKLILVSCSDYFYNLFVDKQEISNAVDLSDIAAPSIVENILICMYTGRIHLTELNVESFLKASIKLGFFIIQDACEEFLIEKMTLNNCLKMLDTSFRYSLNNLSESALQLAAKQFKTLLKKTEFTELPVEQVTALLKRDDLASESELEVFRAMNTWLDYRRQDRLHHASDLMHTVRLPLLSPSTIVDSIESETHLMDIPDCLKLVKDALHYHCMPARQSLMQSPRTIPRGMKKVTCIIATGGAPRMKTDDVSKDIMRYNFEKNSLEHITDMPEPRHHHAVAVLGGFLYIAGGESTNDQCNPDNKVHRYDPRHNTWLQVASMKHNRQSFQMTVLSGMIYAVGGRLDANTTLSSVERYNPAIDKWEDVAPLSSPKRSVAVTSLNGKLYAVGGCGNKMVSSRLERYKPLVNKWTLRKSITVPRFFASLVPVGGNLYLVGGATVDPDGAISCVEAMEKYTPVSDTWTKITDIKTPRAEFGCCVLDNKLYVMGGYNWNSCSRLSSIECLDLDTNIWTQISDLPDPLVGIASCALALYRDCN